MPSEVEYANDGVKVYDSAGDLVGHFGYFEALADQIAAFSRPSVAYKQDGSQVAAGVPRYEAARFGQGIMIEEGTTNLAKTNGGATADFSNAIGWTAMGSGQSIANGVATLQSPNGTTVSGFQCTLTNLAQNTKHSFLIRARYKDGTGIAQVLSLDLNAPGYDNSEQELDVLTSQLTTASQNFKKDGFDSQSAPASVALRIFTFSTRPIEVEFVQLEQKAYATSFHDSTRAAEALTVPTTGVFTKGNWAIELIFNPTSIQNIGGRAGYLWFCYIDANNWYRIIITATGQFQISVSSGGLETGYTTALNPIVTPGTKYTIMFSGNGSVIRTCINGVQIASDISYTEPIGSPSANMYIGSDYIGGEQANGTIDDIRISSRARTLAEHQAYVNSGQPQTVDDATTLLMGMDGTLQPTVRGYGLKIIDGEIILAGELNAVGPSGDTALSISAQGDQGKIYFYDEGTSKGSIMINGASTSDLWLRGENGLYLDGGPTIAVGNYAGVTNPGIKFGGDITSDFMPHSDAAYSIGRSNRRWLNVRAQYVTSGDICFTETSCPVCGKPFSPGDAVTLLTHTVDPEKIMCLPIHDGCKNSSYEITAKVPDTVTRYRLNKDGDVEQYQATRTETVVETACRLRAGYILDEESGSFVKQGTSDAVTKDEALETYEVEVERPVYKSITIRSVKSEPEAATEEE